MLYYNGWAIKSPLSTAIPGIPREIKTELCMYDETHPNIVKVMGLAVLTGPYSYGIVFEYGGIELFDYVQTAFGAQENPTKSKRCREHLGFPPGGHTVHTNWGVAAIWDRFIDDFAVQLLNGLVHLHSNGVFHNDIKLENILASTEGNALRLKYADFGLAHCSQWRVQKLNARGQVVGDEFVGVYSSGSPVDLRAEHPYRYFGSPLYVPDARIATSKGFSYRRDQFSLGITLSVCAYGGFLYRDHKRGSNDSPPTMYDNFLAKVKDIEEDNTEDIFFGQLFNITRRAPIETLLKKLISFQPDFVGEIWKQLSPTKQRPPTCLIENEEKHGDECLKNHVVWDAQTGPSLTRTDA